MMTSRLILAAAVVLGIAASSAPSFAQAPRESVAIRGHWVLEVRDTSQNVVERREFDNALSPASMWLFQDLFRRLATLGPYAIDLRTEGTDAGGAPLSQPFGTSSHRVQDGISLDAVSSAPGFRLKTVVTAPAPGFITGVGTAYSLCPPGTLIANCTRQTITFGPAPFTSTTIAPLRLEQGQMLDVTVTITFGSAPHPPSF